MNNFCDADGLAVLCRLIENKSCILFKILDYSMYGKHKRKSESAIICHWYVSEKPVEKCIAVIVAAERNDGHGEDDDENDDDDDTRISAVAAVAISHTQRKPALFGHITPLMPL